MSNLPLVSGIIIFLNAEKYIKEAIASIIAQTYNNWELLLVDDGSTDKSTTIAQQYAQQYPDKVRYLEHEGHQNHGIGASRNLGIRHAKGKYIGFLDADDIWLPEKLEQQVAILQSYPDAAMVYGHSQIWYSWTGNPEDSHLDYFCELGVQPNTLVNPPTLFHLLLKNQCQTATSSDALLRQEVFDKIGRFEEAFGTTYDDQAFFAKVQLKASVFVADECWSKYRQLRKSGNATTENTESNAERPTFLKWLENYLSEQEVQDTQVWQAFQAELENHSIDKIKDTILSSFSDFNVREIIFLGEGINNRAYRVNKDYIFRFPKHQQAEISLRKEILVLEALRKKLDLSIPKCEYIGNQRRLNFGTNSNKLQKLINKSKKLISFLGEKPSNKASSNGILQHYEMLFVGYQEIKGSFLYPEFVLKLPKDMQEFIAKDIAKFLEGLHSFPVAEVSHIGLGVKDFGEKYYRGVCNLIQQDVLPQLSSSHQKIISNLFDEFIKDHSSYKYKPTLLHGDLNWDHIIYNETENKIVGFIDFGGIFIGDPAYDFMGILFQYGEEFLESILSYYCPECKTEFIRKIKLLHCCDCTYEIHKGLKTNNDERVEKGWQLLRNIIADLSESSILVGNQ